MTKLVAIKLLMKGIYSDSDLRKIQQVFISIEGADMETEKGTFVETFDELFKTDECNAIKFAYSWLSAISNINRDSNIVLSQAYIQNAYAMSEYMVVVGNHKGGGSLDSRIQRYLFPVMTAKSVMCVTDDMVRYILLPYIAKMLEAVGKLEIG